MQNSRWPAWEAQGTIPNLRTDYIVGSHVDESYIEYICLVEHTSTGDFPADLASGYWRLATAEESNQFKVSHIGYGALGSSIAFQRQNGSTRILRGSATTIVGNKWVHGEMTEGVAAVELGGIHFVDNYHAFPDQPSMKDTWPLMTANRYARAIALGDGGSDMPHKASKRPITVLNNTFKQGQKADKTPEAYAFFDFNGVEYMTDIRLFNNHVIAEFVPNAFEFDIESNSDAGLVPTAGPSFGTNQGTYYDYKLGDGVDGVTTLEDRLGNTRPLSGANKGSVG
jgi:hypothetical protein